MTAMLGSGTAANAPRTAAPKAGLAAFNSDQSSRSTMPSKLMSPLAIVSKSPNWMPLWTVLHQPAFDKRGHVIAGREPGAVARYAAVAVDVLRDQRNSIPDRIVVVGFKVERTEVGYIVLVEPHHEHAPDRR